MGIFNNLFSNIRDSLSGRNRVSAPFESETARTGGAKTGPIAPKHAKTPKQAENINNFNERIKKAHKKGSPSDAELEIIENFRNQLDQYDPHEDYRNTEKIKYNRQWYDLKNKHRDAISYHLENAIIQLGAGQVANNIKNHQTTFSFLIDTILYDSHQGREDGQVDSLLESIDGILFSLSTIPTEIYEDYESVQDLFKDMDKDL